MKKVSTWLIRNECTLCLDGYPIQIIRHNARSYEVTCEGLTASRTVTLAMAKLDAQRLAEDLDAFNPDLESGDGK